MGRGGAFRSWTEGCTTGEWGARRLRVLASPTLRHVFVLDPSTKQEDSATEQTSARSHVVQDAVRL
jgi:hypothetical protein